MYLIFLVPTLFQINQIINTLSQKRPQDKSLYPFPAPSKNDITLKLTAARPFQIIM